MSTKPLYGAGTVNSEMEAEFDGAWAKYSGAREGETVSPELRSLVRDVHAEVVRQPANLLALKSALERLLAFLASPAGRTNANCWAVDLFFTHDDAWPEALWEHLPDEFADVLSDMGGALHDTGKEPAMAESFDSLPEQLLARVRSIAVSGRAV